MPEKILLVEDEALIALFQRGLLERHGFDVVVTHNGEDALRTATSDPTVSLILMDIDLGSGMDGTEAAQQILEERHVPIIFLTSHTEKEYVDRVEKISGYGYVLKNSGEFVLVESIRMAYKLFEAYRRMEESEQKYRAAFMTSPDSVNINRLDGLFVDINEGFTALTGYSREDVTGKLSSEIDIWAIPEDRERLVRGLETDGYVENLESRFRCKDGSLKTALMSARLIALKGEPHILSITRDISEKKEIEERLALAVEGSRDGIWDWNLLTDEAFHSDRFATMLGYRPDELPYTRAAWSELVHPDDSEAAYRAVDRYLSGKEPSYEATFRMRTKSGEYRWISGRGKAVFDERGNAVRFVGFNTDVTDRMRTEEEVQASKRFLDTISDIAYEADTEGNITYVNPAVETVTGIPREQIVERPFSPLICEEDQASLMEVYRRTLAGEVLENTLTFTNGATCHFTSLPRYDATGTVIGTFGVARDITNRLHFEAELEQQREMFKQMFMQHSAVQLLVDPDREARIIEANQAAVDFYGFTRDELLSKSIHELNTLPPNEVKVRMDEARSRSQRRFEFTHRLADGTTREVEVHSSPILHTGRWVLYSIIRDISERVRTEQELGMKSSFLASILKEVPAILYSFGVVTGGITFSARVETILGFKRDELIKNPMLWHDSIHPDDLPRVDHAIQRGVSGEHVDEVYRIRDRAGRWHWFHDVATPWRSEDGSITLNGIALDISEQKERERELDSYREAYQRKLLLLQKSEALAGVGSWEWHILDNSWRMSDSWLRLHGVSENPQTTEELMRLAHPDDAERISQAMQRAREQGVPYDIRHRIVRQDNSAVRHVHAYGTVEFEADTGRPVRMVGAVQDITSVTEQEERLQASLREKDLLMSELNHRVKNNLLMLSSLITLKDQALGDAADLGDLVGRVDAIRIVYENLFQGRSVSSIEMDDYVREVLSALFSLARIEVRVETEINQVTLDSKRAIAVGLIINELATNALKHGFTADAPRVFRVELQSVEGAAAEPDYLLTVANTGRPFPEEIDLAKCESLGMQLVGSLVSQLRGRLELTRKPETRFSIHFPAQE